jgi:hypothetical protein
MSKGVASPHLVNDFEVFQLAAWVNLLVHAHIIQRQATWVARDGELLQTGNGPLWVLSPAQHSTAWHGMSHLRQVMRRHQHSTAWGNTVRPSCKAVTHSKQHLLAEYTHPLKPDALTSIHMRSVCRPTLAPLLSAG